MSDNTRCVTCEAHRSETYHEENHKQADCPGSACHPFVAPEVPAAREVVMRTTAPEPVQRAAEIAARMKPVGEREAVLLIDPNHDSCREMSKRQAAIIRAALARAEKAEGK